MNENRDINKIRSSFNLTPIELTVTLITSHSLKICLKNFLPQTQNPKNARSYVYLSVH